MKKLFLILAILTSTVIVIAQKYSGEKQISQKEILNEKYCTGLFKSADGTILDLTENNNTAIGYTNILDWLDSRVAGLKVYKLRNGNLVPYIRGRQAAIFVNETSIDAGFLNALSTNDIAIIKVIRGPFAGAPGNGGGGAIAIYTIKADDEDKE